MSAAAAPARSVARVRGDALRCVLALAGVEAVRLLRHPIVLAGAALSVLLLLQDLGEYGGRFYLLTIAATMPLAAATMVAANLAALRSRRSDTDELWASTAMPASGRTLAHLLSLAAPVTLAAALVAFGYFAFDAGDGLRVDVIGTTVVPSVTELAQGPLVVLALGALGIALARWLPTVALAPVVIVGFLAIEMPMTSWGVATEWRWLAPVVNHGERSWAPCSREAHAEWGCDGAVGFDIAGMRWHLLYLAGLTVFLAALALLRHGRRPRRLALAAAGLVLVVAAGALQIA